ncbi:MalY/PatB family protein [Alkalilacustris brevis]|uniref:MalY/PatB family protein n=1 Tax=Alkalilacustris brevis TaxID=2026338 RepID=UPI000E0D396B|nr:MalY/PatB family protein [Alkalilacustris brevis]
MDFDNLINRRGTHSQKWDMMTARYDVPEDTGLPMWVADMDFRPPECVREALREMCDHGVFGYFGDDRAYREAICWWMKERHFWQLEPEAIFTAHGLVNGTALCVQTWTQPGEGVVLFTPVYHAFARVIRAAGRRVAECPLVREDGRYVMDFDAYDDLMQGDERMVILCSPHNPGGRVWDEEELQALARFAERHDLIVVSDEIHHDLVMPGQHHTVMANAAPEIMDRLVMMTATTKTFNIAGAHVGNVILPDPELHGQFAKTVAALGISPNSFGIHMATAAYTPEGAAWVDALVKYLDGNRKVFDEAVNAIPGLRSMPLEATYLAWVDFEGTGMTAQEFIGRVEGRAQIAANHGETFGSGGETFLRFNLGTPRALVKEAAERLQQAFDDLQ